MARHRHSQRRRRHRSRGRSMSGGYSSATTFGEHVYGSGDAQYNRVFSTGGPFGNIPGNNILGAQGQGATMTGVPSSAQLSRIQQGGRRKRKGGFIGEVVNQAIVPFGLLGLQQTFRKKRGGRHTRTHRRRRH